MAKSLERICCATPDTFSTAMVPNMRWTRSYVPKLLSTRSFVVHEPFVASWSSLCFSKMCEPSCDVRYLQSESFGSWHLASIALAMTCVAKGGRQCQRQGGL